MNREIKFRALDNKTKVMVFNDASLKFIMGSVAVTHYKYDDLIIQQYTGLKDKNGKEIYEGDVLHVIEDGDYGGEFLGEVEYLDEWGLYGIVCSKVKEIAKSKTNDKVNTIFTRGFLTRCHGSCIALDEVCCNKNFSKNEVIGNIYENPELIKES